LTAEWASRVLGIKDAEVAPDATDDDIIKLLKAKLKTARFNLQVLLYGSETLAAKVPEKFIQRITQLMLRNFLRMAGQTISDRVTQMAEQFRAVSVAA
jgi:hypothetical protein